MTGARPPILFVGEAERGQAFAARWQGAQPMFWCVLAHTETCLVPGLSAAGVSEALRPLTPAADAEVVHLGAPGRLPALPSSPSGVPGPSGITRAALGLLGVRASFVGAGLRVWPATDCVRVQAEPGRNIAERQAVPRVHELFTVGEELGRRCALANGRLVLGESVPGGTTTALAVLQALGYPAAGRVSGSVPGNAHALKESVARAALRRAGIAPGAGRADPLGAVGEVGDPMQPIAAGMAIGALNAGADVLLAGGSQMLAVAALLVAIGGDAALERVALGTTKWIVQDPAADIAGLAADISAQMPVLAVNFDFARSRHAGLRAYEQFRVKEGVGAGGASIAALLGTGCSIDDLQMSIDATYDHLLGRLLLSPQL